MNRQRAIVWAASTAVALGAAVFSASIALADGPTIEVVAPPPLVDAPATQPSAAPATQPVAEQTAKVTPEARKLLDQVKDAYGSLKTLDVTGSVNANFDIDGEQRQHNDQLTGSFQAGGKFREEIKDQLILGFTGEKQFAYVTPENKYAMFDAPQGKVELASLNGKIADTLRQQDLSLALALSSDAGKELTDDASTVSRVDDVKIDDVAYPALAISQEEYDAVLLLDPTSHLLRRVNMDLTKWATARGAQAIKSATVVTDFKNVANAGANQQFAWAPPAGAEEMQAHAPAESSALKGAAAPAFALDGLDGKKVASTDLKGSVYVLDFWATWCGPCVASLPELNKIYEDNKAAGLKVFAVNLEEEKDQVKKFIDEKKITIPVLLDTEGKTAAAYGANAIPETVVVGKDGKVLEVFVGAGNDVEIRKLVESTLKAK